MQILPLVALVLASACRAEAVCHEGPDETGPARETFHSADFAAYRAGRERELEVLRGEVAVTPNALDSIGAAAARLPLEAYRTLAAAIDEFLKAHGTPFDNDGGRAVPFDSTQRHLDSLRIERMVWIVRLGR